MEIIHIILGKANPNRMNGVNIVVNSLATEQANQGHQVTVWGLTKYVAYDFPERNYQTKLFEYNSNILLTIFSLYKAIKKLNNQTIAHIHGGFIPVFFITAFLLKQKGIKFIYTTHGAYNKVAINRSGLKKKIYFFLLEKRVANWATAMHFIGKSEMDIFHTTKTKSKCRLIPNGLIPLEKTEQQLTHSNEPLFGFCGRLSIDEKGLDILLKAFAIYKHDYKKQGNLIIAGDGNDRQQLMKMAKDLGIEQNIEFKGSIFGRQKIQFIENLDAFIHTSRNEGMPTAVLEAASLQVPCIISKETNLGNYVTQSNAGYVLPNNTVTELVKTFLLVECTLKTTKWGQLKQNAAAMVAKHFQWHNIAAQHISLYQKAIAA